MAQGIAFTGCAGWSLPRAAQPAFGGEGSHLQRYATRLNAAEINSSFYRPHAFATYARWAESVPAAFRFSVKLPKAITHERRLSGCDPLLDEFLAQATGLGHKLGCLLAQLPPSLAFDERIARRFFTALRRRWPGQLALEPRHASWFALEADALLASRSVTRVLADPVLHEGGQRPGGWQQLIYLRLHGSPRMYWSAYEAALLAALARRISQARLQGNEVWCIFDNTARGAAADNALALSNAMGQDNA
ncbi:MAG: DUF72 domain-containing protein [Ramlibacter sp.]